jgi:hypothetical protein
MPPLGYSLTHTIGEKFGNIMDPAEMVALIKDAQRVADGAAHAISSHEQVCAERYDNIKLRLGSIPRLFEMIEGNKKDIDATMDKNKDSISDDIKGLTKLVYIGMGICIAIPTIIEILNLFRTPHG